MKTARECQKIIFDLGIELGVSPRLISTRLLDATDKSDMMSGELTIEALRGAVGAWKEAGMQDYVGRGRQEGQPQPQNPGLSGKADLGSDSSFDLVAPFMHHSPLPETLTTKKGAKDGSEKNSTGQEDQKGIGCDPDRGNGTTGVCKVVGSSPTPEKPLLQD